MESISFRFPKLPVSVNRLYIYRGGRKILSPAGRAYRNEFISKCGGISQAELMRFSANKESAYQIHIWYYIPFERLYNIRYGSDKRVASPFADIDVDNMAKLIIDCIARLVGIRDKNNFTVCLHKREAQANEEVIAKLLPINLEDDPYPIEHIQGGSNG